MKRCVTITAALALLAGCGGKQGTSAPAPSAAAECGQMLPAATDAARQNRAMWITTLGNGDWPSRPGLPVARQKAEFVRLLDLARSLNLNTVYVQIRPSADAFYPSPYEPWSRYLTGVPGRDPGYDPLKFMVEEAHARGLEFHAWFNPFRVSTGPDPAKLAPNNPARRHPDWVHRYGGALWYDPGLPQVRDLVDKVVMDVVNKYDIDGVHLDDYFYPYPVPGKAFPDKATFRRYGAGFTNVGDWRRHNIDELVQGLSTRIHRAKPWVKFGISPFGVWRNRSSDPNGSATRALQSYDDIYADTRTWVKNNWVDYIAPQLYWPIGYGPADYRTLVAWWAEQVAGTRVQLIIGQAGYRVGHGGPWNDGGEISRHLSVDARYPQVRGEAFFSARDLAQNHENFAARLFHDHYERPAVVPVTPGTAGPPPAPPTRLEARNGRLSWRGSGAAAYAIYRVLTAKTAGACLPPGTGTLLKVVGGDTHQTRDTTARPGRGYAYYVTALDRTHRESSPSRTANMTAG